MLVTPATILKILILQFLKVYPEFFEIGNTEIKPLANKYGQLINLNNKNPSFCRYVTTMNRFYRRVKKRGKT